MIDAVLCGLMLELTGTTRQDGQGRLAKMYGVPPTGPGRPAAVRPVERGVRPQPPGAGVGAGFGVSTGDGRGGTAEGGGTLPI